jgi:hypothetical protein
MTSNIAYWLETDFGCHVKDEAQAIGDFDFDLRWRVGDLASVNAALTRYGLEVSGEAKRDGEGKQNGPK